MARLDKTYHFAEFLVKNRLKYSFLKKKIPAHASNETSKN